MIAISRNVVVKANTLRTGNVRPSDFFAEEFECTMSTFSESVGAEVGGAK